MGEDITKGLSNVIRIDDERLQDHLRHIVRGSVEDTLNAVAGCGGGSAGRSWPLRAHGRPA